MSGTVQNATCVMCGDAFSALRRDARYCGSACRSAASRARKRGEVVGSVAEEVVAKAAQSPEESGGERVAESTLAMQVRRLAARLEVVAAESDKASARHEVWRHTVERRLESLERRAGDMAGEVVQVGASVDDLEEGTLTAVRTLDGRLEALEETLVAVFGE